MDYNEVIDQIDDTDSEDWTYVQNGLWSVYCFRNDLDIRIEHHDENDVINRNFQEAWANQFPDPSAISYGYGIYYRASLFARAILVCVDGGRALLPLPDRQTMIANKVNSIVSRIVHDDWATFTKYLKQAGISLT